MMMLALKRKIRENLFMNLSLRDTRFGLCLIGLPGGKKTITTMDTLFGEMLDLWSRADIPITIAMPTRTLRDWCARYLVDKYLHQDEVIIFKSKLEFCDAVRKEFTNPPKKGRGVRNSKSPPRSARQGGSLSGNS